MVKMTVLELTQAILSNMSSDEVNSYADTTESLQVAMQLRDTYYDIIGNVDRPDQFDLIQFEASGNTDRPTHMHVPENVDHFSDVQYRDTSTLPYRYREVCYLPKREFMIRLNSYTSEDSTTTVVQDFSSAYLSIKNDKHPQWYTTFDDEWLVFDSYDSTIDDTLQNSKILAFGKTIPIWVMEDNAYPDLPAKYFPQLLAEASEACMWYQRQMQDPIALRRGRRQYVKHFNNRNRPDDAAIQTTPNFGRRR